MNTYQQIKSLKCEPSLIILKELVEKENSEVIDKKVKCKEMVKGCCIELESIFSGPR